MNPPMALSPLVAHIPHAVPVVIIWGIMLRFYLAQRKLNRAGQQPVPIAPQSEPAAAQSVVSKPADRPAPRRFRIIDDAAALAVPGGVREAPVSVGPTPTTGLE